jgi:hypothetical protein
MHIGCNCKKYQEYSKYINTYEFKVCPFCGNDLQKVLNDTLIELKDNLPHNVEINILQSNNHIEKIKIFRVYADCNLTLAKAFIEKYYPTKNIP